MGIGASTSLYRRDSSASLGRQGSFCESRGGQLRSSLGSVWQSLKHAGSSLRHSASGRLRRFDSSFYNRGDDRPEYVHYSVYGDGEGSDPDDPLVYELQRTRAMDERQWFDMAAANEQLTKMFNTTKNTFAKYYKKHWQKKKELTPEERREQEIAKNRWREFFVKTQDEHEERRKAQEEARRQRAEELARLPPPVPHPCAGMTADAKIRYYENLFGYTLRRASWVESPNWQSLEVPARRTRRLQSARSSSSSSSVDSNHSSTSSGSTS